MGGRLTDAQTEAIRHVLECDPDVAAAWVFGSFARGEATATSDLDIAIVWADSPSDGPADRHVSELASRLEGIVPGHAIDIVALEDQGPIFQHRALTEGLLVLDANPERRIDVESTAYVRYFDFRPTYDIAAAHAREGFLRWVEAERKQ